MKPKSIATLVCSILALTGGLTEHSLAQVRIVDRGANAVSLWSEQGAAIINQRPAASGTAQERRPVFFVDMATLHVAIHEAIEAAPQESQQAAVHGAAYTVLKTLFPQRVAQFQGAYDTALAGLPAGPAKDQGLVIGQERAKTILAQRADDGRWAEITPAVPGTAPGAFRGIKPINQTLPRVKPFVLDSISQFRSPAPPPLASSIWATELAETQARGGVGKPATEREVENARFHTERPPAFWARNLNRFARSQPTLPENAHLMALLWMSNADAITACFESKYHYYRWRPASAIVVLDPTWKPRLATPNHPEYPAAHGCGTAAFAETLAIYFGTRKVAFSFDSSVTGNSHNWATVDEMVEEVRDARIVGGMHFRTSMIAGEMLGSQVAKLVVERHGTSSRREK